MPTQHLHTEFPSAYYLWLCLPIGKYAEETEDGTSFFLYIVGLVLTTRSENDLLQCTPNALQL